MKRRLLSILLALCMVLCLAPMAAFAEGEGDITGTGTAEDPYLIYTADGLKQFAVSARESHAKLMNDIVLNDGIFDDDGNYTKGASGKDAEQWTPIANRFAGIFDGDGHTIRGLYVKDKNNAGLFDTVFGTVKNLTVTGYVSGTQKAGGIASQGGTFENCVNQCRVIAKHGATVQAWAGGIVGYGGTVRNCVNMGRITSCSGYDVAFAGGLVGQGSAAGCYNVGEVDGSSNRLCLIGGITGYGGAENCYWLEGTAEKAIGSSGGVAANTKAEFADGTVLNLLKGDSADSPWADECKYVAAAGMTLPVFKGQSGDDHTCVYEWKYNDTQHWKECACGVMEPGSTASHSEKTGICTEGIKCECGYEIYPATSGHNWGEWQHLTTSHTRGCDNPGCGMTQSENCSGGTATCTEQATCDVCHEKYGTPDSNNHTGTLDWTQTATTHQQEWSCCHAETVAEESHNWADGVCTECGYGCHHSDENHDHKCDLCDKVLSDCADNDRDHKCDLCDKVLSTCADENHDHKCDLCDKVLSDCADNDRDHKCDLCDKVLSTCADENRDHKCDLCDKVLSTCADENHDHKCDLCDKVLSTCADGNHDHKCDLCDKVLSEHSGGTATCTEQAVCAVCGEAYGETDAANHAHLKHVDAKAATEAEEGNIEHWFCPDCGKYFADRDASKEITKADTVVAKLPATPEQPETPTTGDHSHLVLWTALLVVSGAAVAAAVVTRMKKRGED